MIRQARRFRQLPPHERRAFLGCWLLLAAVAAVLPWVSPARLAGWLERVPPALRRAGGRPRTSAQRLAELMALAARHHPLRPTCLARSLGLAWRLRRRGEACRLRIGVRRDDGRLSAHAWVDLADGRPLGEPAAAVAGFLPLAATAAR